MNVNLRRIVLAAVAGGLLSGVAAPAFADSTEDIVNALIAKGVLTEEEGGLLLKGRTGEKEAAAKAAKKQASVEVGKKGLVVKSGDGAFDMQIGGRLHVDVANHSNDDNLTGNVKAMDGTEIRRGRIYMKGHAYKDWEYMIETDFGGNKVGIKDLYLMYSGFDAPVEVTVGHQKHAVSMEVQESSNDIMFTERSMVSALTIPYFDRAIGMNVKGFGNNWNVQGGIYGDHVSQSANKNIDEGRGFGIRGTFTPILEKDRLIHLGLNYGYRKLDDNGQLGDKNEFGYETTNASELKLFKTAVTNMETVKTGIAEFAAMYGPFSFQSEYAKTTVERKVGQDLDFDAWYAQVGWTLTGESRSYKGSDGEFKRLKPHNNFDWKNGTWGAWEVAARYDALDLVDSTIMGGDGKRYTIALNWYLNDNMRLMADYSKTFDINNGPVTKIGGGEPDNIDVYTVRAQWAF